jgi:hypothetical protein
MNLAPEKSGAFFCPKFPAPTWFGALITVSYLCHQHLIACHINIQPAAHRLSYPHTTTNNYINTLITVSSLRAAHHLRYAATRCYNYHATISYRMKSPNLLITVSSLRAAPLLICQGVISKCIIYFIQQYSLLGNIRKFSIHRHLRRVFPLLFYYSIKKYIYTPF